MSFSLAQKLEHGIDMFMVYSVTDEIFALDASFAGSLPPARENRTILLVVLLAMAVSFLVSILPVLKNIASGFVIIITTVSIAGIAAWLKPIEDEV